ncbi:MAG: HAMP domain-containing histidine kinase [Clostridia bacterium]|nr:HAMP domain-containing histidine kinase [Clostridia bacterium]
MVAGVAHELNTPIGVAITATSFLKQKKEEFFQKLLDGKISKHDLEIYLEAVEESSEIVSRNMERASDLISSFKRVAIDQEKMLKERMNLDEIVEATVKSLSLEIKKKFAKVDLSFSGDLSCESYPGVWSQVMTNLIQNSLLHAFHDVEMPNIGIRCYEDKEHELIIINYWDNGRGINSEDLDRIYDPFYTTAAGSGGTGLGMNIVFNLVTATLMGEIQYKEYSEYGVFFEIIVPKYSLS